MSEIKDKVKEKIASYLWMHLNNPITHDLEALRRASQILSIPGIAIVDRKAELPGFIDKVMANKSADYIAGLQDGINRLLKAGYVKEVKE